MSKKSYDANNIKSLTGIESVQMYPSMFLGSCGAAGIQQAVKEIVTNSIDEALNGYATGVIVNLLENNKISIKDDGRGMPAGINKESGKTGIDMCVGDVNAGGKYNKDAYASSGGMHGIGASATNAISSIFTVIVHQDCKIHQVEYRGGYKFSPKAMNKTNIMGKCDKGVSGTEIIFTPSTKIMEEDNFDMEAIMTYLKQLSFLNSGIKFTFIDSRIKNQKPVITKYYTEKGLTDYIAELVKDKQTLIKDPIYIKDLVFASGDKCEIAFQYTRDHKAGVYLFVNKNSVPNGGTAVTGFKMGLTKALNDISRILGIMKPKERPLKSSDTEEGLVAVISMIMAKPELEGQTKNKLNNTNVQGFMQSTIGDLMKIYFEENPNVTSKIADKALLGRRAREASSKARNLIMNKLGASSQSPAKLKGCKSNKAAECELMLVEG